MPPKKYIVIKKEETEETETQETETQTETQIETEETQNNKEYIRPINGTKQDNYTKKEIKQQLKGYLALKTDEDKKILLTLKPFKVWIKYVNLLTNEYRVGGLLKIVDKQLRYIMLTNLNSKLTWSVQLKDCIIFISKDIEEKENIRLKEQIEKDKEEYVKNKLYKLYKRKLLKRV